MKCPSETSTQRPAFHALLPLAATTILLLGGAAIAAPAADSPYVTDAQNSHVEDETGQAIGTVNMIMCFMNNMRPDLMVNQGAYAAMLDTTRCEEGADNSTPNYVRALINSTRASNDVPMGANVWLEYREGQGDNEMDIFIRTTVSGAPTANNPYGQFRLDYGAPQPGGNGPQMQGFLQSDANGVSFVERSNRGPSVELTQLHLQGSSRDAGSGVLRYPIWGTSNSRTVTFGYNNTHFRRFDGTNDRCFSRSLAQAKTSVWRYGLYDPQTGARIDRESGFPFSTQLSNGKAHGYIGYHGLSAAPDQLVEMVNGTAIEREARDGTSAQTYTLVRNRGKLMRHIRRTKALATLDGIAIQTNAQQNWPGLPAALAGKIVAMAWNDTDQTFVISRKMECGQTGCNFVDLASPHAMSGSALAGASPNGLFAHSEQLGGQVYVSADAMLDSSLTVSYRASHIVHPGALPTGTTFYCTSNCPSANGLSQLASQSVDHPFGNSHHNYDGLAAGQVTSYVMNGDGVLTDNGAPLVYSGTKESLDGSHFGSGIQSGRLVTDLNSLQCTDQSGNYCPERAENQQEFYTWETGPNPWNEYAGARDGDGDLVSFDPPLRVVWQVPNDAAYGNFANRAMVLRYSGFGDLHGLPSYCVNPGTNETVACGTANARWVPLLSIPDNTDHGIVTVEGESTRYLVKWLEREVRFAPTAGSACSAIALGDVNDLPGTDSIIDPSDPSSADYIGDKPQVSDAPRIINGVAQD